MGLQQTQLYPITPDLPVVFNGNSDVTDLQIKSDPISAFYI